MKIRNKILTKRDVIMLNTQENSCVVLDNTIGQNSDIIKLISPNVQIRVLGGYNPKNNTRFAQQKYAERTIYSPQSLASVIKKLEEIESKMNENFSEMEKAFFGFKKLIETIQYDDEQLFLNHNRNLECLTTGFARCAGFSMCYKEFLDRQHIKNEFKNVPNMHSYNVLTINNKHFVVDVTWGRNDFDDKKDYLNRFGRLDVKKNFLSHLVVGEEIPDYDILTKQEVKQIASKVNKNNPPKMEKEL